MQPELREGTAWRGGSTWSGKCRRYAVRNGLFLSRRPQPWSPTRLLVAFLSGDPHHDGADGGILVSRFDVWSRVCAFLYAVAATLGCFRLPAVSQVGQASIRFICYLIDYPELAENVWFS